MSLIRRVGLSLALAGVDPIAIARTAATAPRFVADAVRYNRMARSAGAEPVRWRSMLPALSDRTVQAGATSSEYFIGDLWTARRIKQHTPDRHLDVGSRVDGLVAHLLTFAEVDVVDIRPLRSTVTGLHVVQADATSLDGIPDRSVASVSSVHALEHFGLGRYGDPVDPQGHVRGLRALGRVLSVEGNLYVGIPIGRPLVEFNADRIVDPRLVMDTLPELSLESFAAVIDNELVETVVPEDLVKLSYALGLYHLRRPS